MAEEIKIEGLDMIDVLNFIDKKKKKFIAIMLSELELNYDEKSEEYKFLRKVILDGMNDYTRSLLRVLFGEVEGLVQK
jgi:hypothetical protein